MQELQWWPQDLQGRRYENWNAQMKSAGLFSEECTRSLPFILLLWALFSTGQPSGTRLSAATLTSSRKVLDNLGSCLCWGRQSAARKMWQAASKSYGVYLLETGSNLSFRNPNKSRNIILLFLLLFYEAMNDFRWEEQCDCWWETQ